MRNSILWTSALVVTLALAERTAAQPPRGRGGPGAGLDRVVEDLNLSRSTQDAALAIVQSHQAELRRLAERAGADLMRKAQETLSEDEFRKLRDTAEGRRVSTDDMVERLMSFDKNGDGKVTKEELPERMHSLLAKGDLNKDGALDRDEIKKLAADGSRQAVRGPRGGRGPGSPLPAVERAVDELKLSGKKQETMTAAARECRDRLRQQEETSRVAMLFTMTEVLNQEELNRFLSAVERRPRGPRPGR